MADPPVLASPVADAAGPRYAGSAPDPPPVTRPARLARLAGLGRSGLVARVVAAARPAGLARVAREPYAHLFAAQLAVAGTAVLANILIARALAPSGRGEIALMLQLGYLTSQLILLGSERSFMAGYSAVTPRVAVRAYTRLLAVPCLVGLALIVVVAVAVPERPPVSLVLGVAAFTVVNALVRAVRAVAVASGRPAGFLGSTAASQVLLLAGLGVLTVTGDTRPAAWLGVYVLAGAIPAAACWLAWSRGTAGTLRRPEVLRRRAVRREGLALLPSAIANMGMLRIDRLVLPALASTAALGSYATVATMTELLSWPLQSYADARLGAWRTADSAGGLRVWRLLAAALVYAAVAAPVLGVAVFVLVVPLFGDPYTPAKALVMPLIAASAAYGVSRVSLGVLVARRRTGLASAAEVAGFVVSLAGYALLIPPWGARGAAWGSLAGYAACLAVAQLALYRSRRPGAGTAP